MLLVYGDLKLALGSEKLRSQTSPRVHAVFLALASTISHQLLIRLERRSSRFGELLQNLGPDLQEFPHGPPEKAAEPLTVGAVFPSPSALGVQHAAGVTGTANHESASEQLVRQTAMMAYRRQAGSFRSRIPSLHACPGANHRTVRAVRIVGNWENPGCRYRNYDDRWDATFVGALEIPPSRSRAPKGSYGCGAKRGRSTKNPLLPHQESGSYRPDTLLPLSQRPHPRPGRVAP